MVQFHHLFLHFYCIIIATFVVMFSVSTERETHLLVFNPSINYNKLHICHTQNYSGKV